MPHLPVIVIGAGPQGLAAAAHLLERGIEPLVLEAASHAAAAVREWGHVRLFSAWPELVDAAAARLLAPRGWEAPTTGHPTGTEWADAYLTPLADALGERVRYDARVIAVARKGRDLLTDAGRAEQPFVVHTRDAAGREARLEARAVVDASGTWAMPGPAGADGLPALGEGDASARISYRIPDRAQPQRYAGRRTIVVGAGHSALNALLELTRIAEKHPDTEIVWAVRRGNVESAFGGESADALVERGMLGRRARRAVEEGSIELATGFRVGRIDGSGERVRVVADDGRALVADELVVLTGFRPDLSFLSEVRLELDARVQAPVRLAGEIDPNIHSCGTVRATGAAELAQPEPDFYLVGMKSYGRAPTFLVLTGYEQVRSVVAALAGDHEAAARVELALPETGVCGGSGLDDVDLVDSTLVDATAGGSCCAVPTARQPVSIGARPTL